ncbi:hypothetical protein K7X08_035465 [Anisodus acutangulus]|uniref:CASP-like protein n=1 Tax=Anisodus acutangulus TaxID=402998 RepID=A0A9Q1LL54_9SOLA|nr:hypothetical protein K7X08_035465 [Anisodus acutangulus]
MNNMGAKTIEIPPIKSQKYSMCAQILLRILATTFTLTAACLIFTSDETVNVFTIEMEARYSYSPALKFFAYANIIGCAFSVFSLFLASIYGRMGIHPSKYFYLFIHDMQNERQIRWDKSQTDRRNSKANQSNGKMNIKTSRSNMNLDPTSLKYAYTRMQNEVVNLGATNQDDLIIMSRKQRKFKGKVTIPSGVLSEGEFQHTLANGELLTIKKNIQQEIPQIDIQKILKASVDKLKNFRLHEIEPRIEYQQ